jgi:anti-sigma-K factor RskA
MRTHEEFSENCAAYVLGALSEDEAAELRAHIEECAACREQVARLTAVAAALGRGVPPVAAPPELRRRVLGVVEAEAALFAAAERPSRPSRGARAWLRPAYALAAVAALALGIALGALVVSPGGGSTRIVRAAVAPAARWGAARSPLASLHESGNSAVLVVSHMPAAPRGKIYEVWVLRGKRPEPTDALFNANAAGDATVAVPPSLRGAAAVLVTAERLGGARVPTMQPLISAPLG